MTEGKTQHKTTYEELKDTVKQVYRQVKHLIKEGTARRIIIRDNEEERTMLDIPMVVGIAGTVLASYTLPLISAIAFYLFGLNDVSIFVERATKD
jgi:acyl-coenzyme A synthetase/AMP-(fatty) acid ligase